MHKNLLQCNLSKPDPNGTKYFVRFRQDPDYSDSCFREKFSYFIVALIIKFVIINYVLMICLGTIYM